MNLNESLKLLNEFESHSCMNLKRGRCWLKGKHKGGKKFKVQFEGKRFTNHTFIFIVSLYAKYSNRDTIDFKRQLTQFISRFFNLLLWFKCFNIINCFKTNYRNLSFRYGNTYNNATTSISLVSVFNYIEILSFCYLKLFTILPLIKKKPIHQQRSRMKTKSAKTTTFIRWNSKLQEKRQKSPPTNQLPYGCGCAGGGTFQIRNGNWTGCTNFPLTRHNFAPHKGPASSFASSERSQLKSVSLGRIDTYTPGGRQKTANTDGRPTEDLLTPSVERSSG